MTIEAIRQMHRTRPFRPFQIHMVDGRAFPVDHPERIAFFPSGRSVVVALPDETFEVIALAQIVSLRTGSAGNPAGQS